MVETRDSKILVLSQHALDMFVNLVQWSGYVNTSCFHGNKNSVLHNQTKMAFSISSLWAIFEGNLKSISRGENHYKSGHVDYVTYAEGVLKRKVHASMKDKVYSVKVSLYHFWPKLISARLP